MRRVHKSARWVAGEMLDDGTTLSVADAAFMMDEDDPDDIPYYRPEPWKGTTSSGHTWQPPKPTAPAPAPARSPVPHALPPPTAPKPQYTTVLTPMPTNSGPLSPNTLPSPSVNLNREPTNLLANQQSNLHLLPRSKALAPKAPKPFGATENIPIHVAEQEAPLEFQRENDYTDYPGDYASPEEPQDEFVPPAAPIPPPPPIPTLSNWNTAVPTRPLSLYNEDKENTPRKLNLQDFEKVRKYGKKTTHNAVSPQVCFSLSDDLRNMKGKGGKLFAKRRAKADKWVVDETPKLSAPNKEFMAKVIGDHIVSSPESPLKDSVDSSSSAPVGKPRLQNMIKRDLKSSLSPWEAAASQSGDIERAFDHLNYYTLPTRGKKGGGRPMSAMFASELTGTAFTSSNPAAADAAPSYSTATTYHRGRPQASPPIKPNHSAVSPSNGSTLPDYTRKIQPWTPAAGSASNSDAVNDWSDPGE